MFDSRKEISERVVDAVDLAIDFATLGEYGLEPVEAKTSRPCEARRRPGSMRRSTGAWRSAIDHFTAQS